jgi:hypothetical protein
VKVLLLGPETLATRIALLFLVVEGRLWERHTGCQIEMFVASLVSINSLRRSFTFSSVHREFGEHRNFSESHRFLVVRVGVFGENWTMQNDALQQILMTASRERSERIVLRIVVDGLAEQPQVALARICLLRPGDIRAN